MKFERDEAKAKSNLEKHGVSCALSVRVFDDIGRSERADEDDEWHDEERWVTTGLVGGTELVVVYTVRGDKLRLISARGAERYEREEYWRDRYERT